MNIKPYLLKNQIQYYSWGTRGPEAFIPHLLGIQPVPGKAYAELWMGTHANAPSSVIINGSQKPLDRLIAENPCVYLGRQVAEKFNNKLPFLFKILSAGQALSIQAHPDKNQAEILHARDPEHYPDDNHKPEIAIALDSLTAMVGFKSYHGMWQTLERYPELADFVSQNLYRPGQSATSAPARRDWIKQVYTTLMNRSLSQPKALCSAIDKLAQRLKADPGEHTVEEKLFLALKNAYPGDVGLFSIFLFNLVHLQKNQGIYLDAGIPHAYIKGNIIECMANSDNVVRAGLTPKFKDVATLAEILTYETDPVPILAEHSESDLTIYRTPAPEFQVERRKLAAGQTIVELSDDHPAILIIIEGEIRLSWQLSGAIENMILKPGQSIFIPAAIPGYKIFANRPAVTFKARVP